MSYGPPPQPPQSDPPPPAIYPGGGTQGAADAGRKRVVAPAVGLIVTGAVGILLAGTSLAMRASIMNGYADMLQQMNVDANLVEQLRASGANPTVFDWFFGAVAVLSSFVTLFGGISMAKCRMWPLALAGAIVGMLPCISGCCCIGLPAGIWALVVLMNRDVRAAFEATAAGS